MQTVRRTWPESISLSLALALSLSLFLLDLDLLPELDFPVWSGWILLVGAYLVGFVVLQ